MSNNKRRPDRLFIMVSALLPEGGGVCLYLGNDGIYELTRQEAKVLRREIKEALKASR
jgi:hypothetical protein